MSLARSGQFVRWFTGVRFNLYFLQADLNWSEILDNMDRCLSFNELHELVSKLKMLQLLCTLHTEMLENEKDILDYVALHHLPGDPPDSFAPLKIYGDINCCPRYLSYLVYSHENNHVKMRIRIEVEGVLNKGQHLQEPCIKKGAPNTYSHGTMSLQFAMYSDTLLGNVESTYENEMIDVARSGSYMGIWQFLQAANVILCPIQSIYSSNSIPNLRAGLNRVTFCINNNNNNNNNNKQKTMLISYGHLCKVYVEL